MAKLHQRDVDPCFILHPYYSSAQILCGAQAATQFCAVRFNYATELVLHIRYPWLTAWLDAIRRWVTVPGAKEGHDKDSACASPGAAQAPERLRRLLEHRRTACEKGSFLTGNIRVHETPVYKGSWILVLDPPIFTACLAAQTVRFRRPATCGHVYPSAAQRADISLRWSLPGRASNPLALPADPDRARTRGRIGRAQPESQLLPRW